MDLHHTALAATLAVVAALTVWRPPLVLTLILAILPVVAQHPSAAPAVWLYAAVLVFELGYVLRHTPFTPSPFDALVREPLPVLGLAFGATAVASLAALPVGDLWAEYLTALRQLPLGAATWRLEVGLRAFEFEREFSVVSTALTLQAVVLMLIVARETRHDAGRARSLARAIAAGAWVAAVAGLVEWSGAVDLTAVRGTFAVFARPGSVQSTAGNPGWFTEALVYTVPYAIVLGRHAGSEPRRRWPVATVYLGVLTVALALGLQRGGWIAGGLSLVWTTWALARVLPDSARPGRWQLLGAVAAGVLPLALIVALAARLPADGTGVDVGHRVRDLVNADRWPYWQAAALIWTRHPVLGGGHESFAYRYRRYFLTPGGVFESSPVRVPDGAAAHSLYMQTLAGTGLGGLVVLLAMFGAAAVVVRRVLRDDRDPDRRAVALAAGGSVLGVAVYGLAQEVFYVPALRMLAFVALGLVAGAAAGRVTWPARRTRAVAVALALVAVVHVAYEHVWASPDRLVSGGTYGLLPLRPTEAPGPIQWTGEEAAWPVPAGATTVALEFRSLAPFPQRVQVRGCASVTTFDVSDNVWHEVQTPLHDCGAGTHAWLSVRPSWRPPGDGRLLGVLVRNVRLY